jgi:hypothetical protein
MSGLKRCKDSACKYYGQQQVDGCNTCSLSDAVNHPTHYGGDSTYETIKVIEAWNLNFNLGNAVKYISRAGKKDDIVQDLEKARFYLDREINNIKNNLE